jgi:hypothetical protein
MLSASWKVGLFWLLGLRLAFAADLTLAFVTPKAVYHLGENVPIHVVWHNTSQRPLRILPDIPAAPNGCFNIRAVDSAQRPEIIACGQLSIDFEGTFKDAKLLKPGQSYSRDVSCKFVSHLPAKYWGSRPSGLYLLWGITAVRLPSDGRYMFKARYEMIRDFQVDVARYFKPPLLWLGKIYSQPVTIEFRR